MAGIRYCLLLGKLYIFRTIFQRKALSSDIPASQKSVYLFYDPTINCYRGRDKTASYGHGIISAKQMQAQLVYYSVIRFVLFSAI